MGVWTSGVAAGSSSFSLLVTAASWIIHLKPLRSPLTMEHKGRTVWTPKAPGVTLRPIPDAPAPADTLVKRQTMRNAHGSPNALKSSMIFYPDLYGPENRAARAATVNQAALPLRGHGGPD